MASQFDVHMVSSNVGALSNGVRAIAYLPAGGGDITVLSGHVMSNAAGTSAVNLIAMGAAGTAAAGTIGTLGSAVYVAGVPKSFTIASGIVDGGQYIGVEETNVGTTNAITIVGFSYVMGK
jgi:hypothetical protein